MICLRTRWSLILLPLVMMSTCKKLSINEILKAIREAYQEDDVIESIRRSPEKMVAFVDDDPLGGKSLLMYAAAYDRLSIAKFLLNSGADVNQQSIFHGRPMNTPLIYAASWGHEEMVKLLLSSGAQVDVQGSMASSALMFAAVNGHREVVKLLLDAGAKTDLQDTKGQTALALASWYGHADVVKLLVEAGADLNIQRHLRYSGSTPLIKAQGMNELEVVSTLTQAGANLNIQDAYGYTVTHYMAKGNDDAGLKIVLPYCPNLTIREHETNATAADLALANGYISTAQLLLGHTNKTCLSQLGQKDLSGLTNVVETFEAYTGRADMVTESGGKVSIDEHKFTADEGNFEVTTSHVNLFHDSLESVETNEIKDIDYGAAKLGTYRSEFLENVTEKLLTKRVLTDSNTEVYHNEHETNESRSLQQNELDDYSTNTWKEIDLGTNSSDNVAFSSTDNYNSSQVLIGSDSTRSHQFPLEFPEGSLTTSEIIGEDIIKEQVVSKVLTESDQSNQDHHILNIENIPSFRVESDSKDKTNEESHEESCISSSQLSDKDSQIIDSDVEATSHGLSLDQKFLTSYSSEVRSPELEAVGLEGFSEKGCQLENEPNGHGPSVKKASIKKELLESDDFSVIKSSDQGELKKELGDFGSSEIKGSEEIDNLESANEAISKEAPGKNYTDDIEIWNLEVLEQGSDMDSFSISVQDEFTSLEVMTSNTETVFKHSSIDSIELNDNESEKPESRDILDLESNDKTISRSNVDEIYNFGESSNDQYKENTKSSTAVHSPHLQDCDQPQHEVNFGNVMSFEEKVERELKILDSIIKPIFKIEQSNKQSTPESVLSEPKVSKDEGPEYQDLIFPKPTDPGEYEVIDANAEGYLENKNSSQADALELSVSTEKTVVELIHNLEPYEKESSEFQPIQKNKLIQELSIEDTRSHHLQSSEDSQAESESGGFGYFEEKLTGERKEDNTLSGISVTSSTEPSKQELKERFDSNDSDSRLSEINKYPDKSSPLPGELSSYEVMTLHSGAVSKLELIESDTSHESAPMELEANVIETSETFLSDNQTLLHSGNNHTDWLEEKTPGDKSVHESAEDSSKLPDSSDETQPEKQVERGGAKTESDISLVSKEDLSTNQSQGESQFRDTEFIIRENSDGQDMSDSMKVTSDEVIASIENLHESNLVNSEFSDVSDSYKSISDEEPALETKTLEEDFIKNLGSEIEVSELEISESEMFQSHGYFSPDQLELESGRTKSYEEEAVSEMKYEKPVPNMNTSELTYTEESKYNDLKFSKQASDYEDLPTPIYKEKSSHKMINVHSEELQGYSFASNMMQEKELEKPELELPMAKTLSYSDSDRFGFEIVKPNSEQEVSGSQIEAESSDSLSSYDQVQPSGLSFKEEAGKEVGGKISISSVEEEYDQQYEEEKKSDEIQVSKIKFSAAEAELETESLESESANQDSNKIDGSESESPIYQTTLESDDGKLCSHERETSGEQYVQQLSKSDEEPSVSLLRNTFDQSHPVEPEIFKAKAVDERQALTSDSDSKSMFGEASGEYPAYSEIFEDQDLPLSMPIELSPYVMSAFHNQIVSRIELLESSRVLKDHELQMQKLEVPGDHILPQSDNDDIIPGKTKASGNSLISNLHETYDLHSLEDEIAEEKSDDLRKFKEHAVANQESSDSKMILDQDLTNSSNLDEKYNQAPLQTTENIPSEIDMPIVTCKECDVIYSEVDVLEEQDLIESEHQEYQLRFKQKEEYNSNRVISESEYENIQIPEPAVNDTTIFKNAADKPLLTETPKTQVLESYKPASEGAIEIESKEVYHIPKLLENLDVPKVALELEIFTKEEDVSTQIPQATDSDDQMINVESKAILSVEFDEENGQGLHETEVNLEKDDLMSVKGVGLKSEQSEIQITINSESFLSLSSESETSFETSVQTKLDEDKVYVMKDFNNKTLSSKKQISDSLNEQNSSTNPRFFDQKPSDEQNFLELKSNNTNASKILFLDEKNEECSSARNHYQSESNELLASHSETISPELKLSGNKNLNEIELQESGPALFGSFSVQVSADLETDVQEPLKSKLPDEDHSKLNLEEPFNTVGLVTVDHISEEPIMSNDDKAFLESSERETLHSEILGDQNLLKTVDDNVYFLESGVRGQLEADMIYSELGLSSDLNIIQLESEVKPTTETKDSNTQDIPELQEDSFVTGSLVTDWTMQKTSKGNALEITESVGLHLQNLECTRISESDPEVERHSNDQKPQRREEESDKIYYVFGLTAESSSELKVSDDGELSPTNSDQTNVEVNPIDENIQNLSVNHANLQETKVFSEYDLPQESNDRNTQDDQDMWKSDLTDMVFPLLKTTNTRNQDSGVTTASETRMPNDQALAEGTPVGESTRNNALDDDYSDGLEAIREPSKLNAIDEGMEVVEFEAEKCLNNFIESYLQESMYKNSEDIHMLMPNSINEISPLEKTLAGESIAKHESIISEKEESNEKDDSGSSTLKASDDQKSPNHGLVDSEIFEVESVNGKGSFVDIAGENQLVENLSPSKQGHDEKNVLISESFVEVMPESGISDLTISDLEGAQSSEIKEKDDLHHTLDTLDVKTPMYFENVSLQPSEKYDTDLEEVSLTLWDPKTASLVNFPFESREFTSGESSELNTNMQVSQPCETNVSDPARMDPDETHFDDSNDTGEKADNPIIDNPELQTSSENVKEKNKKRFTKEDKALVKVESKHPDSHSHAPLVESSSVSESHSEGIGYVRRIASSFTRLVRELNKEKVKEDNPVRSVSERLEADTHERTNSGNLEFDIEKSEVAKRSISASNGEIDTKMSANETESLVKKSNASREDESLTQAFEKKIAIPNDADNQSVKDHYKDTESAVLGVSAREDKSLTQAFEKDITIPNGADNQSVKDHYKDKESAVLEVSGVSSNSDGAPTTTIDSQHSLLLSLDIQDSVDCGGSNEISSEQHRIGSSEDEITSEAQEVNESPDIPFETSSQMNSEVEIALVHETNTSVLPVLDSDLTYSTDLCDPGQETTENLDDILELKGKGGNIHPGQNIPNEQYSSKIDYFDSIFHKKRLTEEQDKTLIRLNSNELKHPNFTPTTKEFVGAESQDRGYVKRIAAGFNLRTTEILEFDALDLKRSDDREDCIPKIESTVKNAAKHHDVNRSEKSLDNKSKPNVKKRVTEIPDTKAKEIQPHKPNEKSIMMKNFQHNYEKKETTLESREELLCTSTTFEKADDSQLELPSIQSLVSSKPGNMTFMADTAKVLESNLFSSQGSNENLSDIPKSDIRKPILTELGNRNLEEGQVFNLLDEAVSQTNLCTDGIVNLSATEVTEGTNLLENDFIMEISSDNFDNLVISGNDGFYLREPCASYIEETFVNQVIDDAPAQSEVITLSMVTPDHLAFETVNSKINEDSLPDIVEQSADFYQETSQSTEHDARNSKEKSGIEENVRTTFSDKEIDYELDVTKNSIAIPEIYKNSVERDSHETFQEILLNDEDAISDRDNCSGRDLATQENSKESEILYFNQSIGIKDIPNDAVRGEVDTDEMLGIDIANVQYIDEDEIKDNSDIIELYVPVDDMNVLKLEDTGMGHIDASDINVIDIANAQEDVGEALFIPAEMISEGNKEETERDCADFSEDNINIEMQHTNVDNLKTEKMAKWDSIGAGIREDPVEIGTDLYVADDTAMYRIDTHEANIDDEGAAEADLLDLEDIEVATVFANALELGIIEGDRIDVMSVEVPEGVGDEQTIDVSAMFADVVEVENITSGTPDFDVFGTRTPDLGRIESRFIDRVAYQRYAANVLRSDGYFTPTDTLDAEYIDDSEIIFASEVDAVSNLEESIGIDAANEEKVGQESTNVNDRILLDSSRKYSDASIASEFFPSLTEVDLSQIDDPDISSTEETALQAKYDNTNSAEIAVENILPSSEFSTDEDSSYLGDYSAATPSVWDRRDSVSSTCSSVGKDIEDLIIAISKTAYINVASVDPSDQIEPVTEALETNEVLPSDDLQRKLSDASTSSSTVLSETHQRKKLFSSIEMIVSTDNDDDDDDDDFTLTDTSYAGTEFSITSTEDEFERSHTLHEYIQRRKSSHTDDMNYVVERNHPLDGDDSTETDTPVVNKNAKMVHEIVNEAVEISDEARGNKEVDLVMSDTADRITTLQTSDSRSPISTDMQNESTSANNGSSNLDSLDTDVSGMMNLRHGSEIEDGEDSLYMPSEDFSKIDEGKEVSKSSPNFSVINITEAVIITNSEDNSETLIGTMKYSLLNDDSDQKSSNSRMDVTELTASSQGYHVTPDESTQKITSGKSGTIDNHSKDISKESRPPTPSRVSKYLGAITEESRTPTPTGIMRYFDAITKGSRTPTPTGFRKYFGSFKRESRTPTPTRNTPAFDIELEKISRDENQDSQPHGTDEADSFEVEISSEITETFDVEVIGEVSEPRQADTDVVYDADAAIDIAETTIIGDQESDGTEPLLENSPNAALPINHDVESKRTGKTFKPLSSVSQIITAELLNAANQVEKADSLLSLATSQLTEVLTTVSHGEAKQPLATDD